MESRQLESEKCVTPGVAPDVTAPGMTEYMCYQLCTFEVSEGDRWREVPLPPVDVLCWYLNSSTDRDVFVPFLITNRFVNCLSPSASLLLSTLLCPPLYFSPFLYLQVTMEILKKLDWVTSPVGTTMKMESYDVSRVEKS